MPIFDCSDSPSSHEFKIFDRYGAIVFESDDAKIAWMAEKAVYYYPSGYTFGA